MNPITPDPPEAHPDRRQPDGPHVDDSASVARVRRPSSSISNEHGGFRQLPPAALLSSRIGGLVAALLFGIGSSIPLNVLLNAGFSPGLSVHVLMSLAVVTGWALLFWIWQGLSHHRTSYRIDSDGWHIRRGVLWRTEILVPRSRVQHVDINHGPIDRYFGLASLKVHTAGTRLEAVTLNGLEAAQALTLRDALLSHDDDAV